MFFRKHDAQSTTRSGRGPSGAWIACLLILGIGLALRAWLATSLTLTKDEAAYWAWSKHLDPAYAWIPLASIRASCSLFGEREWAVRLPFLLAATGAGAFFFAFSRAVGLGIWSATVALGLFTATTWFHFMGSQAHPDAFLALFWIAALWALARSSRRPRRRPGLWILAGAIAAGAAALSKYSGFMLWPAWLVVAWPSAGRRMPGRRTLIAATAVWLLVVSPAVWAIAAQGGHWVRVAFHLSDLSYRFPLPAVIALLPLAPFFTLVAPGFAVYLVGLASALVRPRAWTGSWGCVGALSAIPVLIAAVHGSVKGNWTLPALWGTLPKGTARFARTSRGRMTLLALVGTGAACLLGVHAAILDPDGSFEALQRIPYSERLDRTYALSVSLEELRHASTLRWSDRVFEYHGARACVDSIVFRANVYAPGTPIVTNLYEVVYQTMFYRRDHPSFLIQDRRFRRTREYLENVTRAPERALYITLPGAQIPTELRLWYPRLGQEAPLRVPIGRHGVRSYDVWRCGRISE